MPDTYAQGLLANDIELAFWNKVLQPLSCRVGYSRHVIHFGPLRETNMSSRIFAGVLAGVVFRISQDFRPGHAAHGDEWWSRRTTDRGALLERGVGFASQKAIVRRG